MSRSSPTDRESGQISAEVSGSGDVVVTVSGLLKVDISGSGSVTYSGEPKSSRPSADQAK